LARCIDETAPAERDDVWRALSLHLRSYPGRDVERLNLRQTLRLLGDLSRPKTVSWLLENQSEGAAARALDRLSRAGLLSVGNRLPGRFDLRISGGFSPEKALQAAFGVLDEIYGFIEPGRRNSLAELLSCCLEADPGRALAQSLHSYSL
jgi:hypothetical protein